MDITGKVNINRKRYGKYLPQEHGSDMHFGRRKKNRRTIISSEAYEEIAGLNDFDTNMLRKSFESRIKKKPLRIELQLEKAEDKLKRVKEEMLTNEILSVNTPVTQRRLSEKRQRIEQQIALHRNEYRNLGLSYKIADSLSQLNQSLQLKIKSLNNFLLNHTPVAQEREKVRYAKTLDKKLTAQMHRPAAYNDGVDFKTLLFQAEKLNQQKSMS